MAEVEEDLEDLLLRGGGPREKLGLGIGVEEDVSSRRYSVGISELLFESLLFLRQFLY